MLWHNTENHVSNVKTKVNFHLKNHFVVLLSIFSLPRFGNNIKYILTYSKKSCILPNKQLISFSFSMLCYTFRKRKYNIEFKLKQKGETTTKKLETNCFLNVILWEFIFCVVVTGSFVSTIEPIQWNKCCSQLPYLLTIIASFSKAFIKMHSLAYQYFVLFVNVFLFLKYDFL